MTKKQLVAHRGASAYAPEHTLESYRLAIEQGCRLRRAGPGRHKGWRAGCIHDLTLERAHAAGLTVTPWTFRASNTGTFASVRDEMTRFLYEYGVDALFTDNPDQFPRK